MVQMYNDNTMRILDEAERLRTEGEYQSAILLLEKLLADEPDNVAALEEIADNELSLERYSRASIAARQAVALDKESVVGHYILGFIASEEERFDDSVDALRRANQYRPDDAEILRCLGWSLFNAGDSAQGVVTLERALNLDPDHPLTLCDLGVVYLRLKDCGKAKALLQRALDLDPANARALECLEMAGRIEHHLKQAERA